MSLSSLLNHTKKVFLVYFRILKIVYIRCLLTYGKTLFDMYNYSMFKLNATCTNIQLLVIRCDPCFSFTVPNDCRAIQCFLEINIKTYVYLYGHGNFLLYIFDYELIKCVYDKMIKHAQKILECIDFVAIYHIWKIYLFTNLTYLKTFYNVRVFFFQSTCMFSQ